MTTYLTYVDGTSAKFWQIRVDGCSHTITFGKIGTAGQSKTKTFDDETACQKDAKKLIKSKKAKGYSEDGTEVTTAEKTVQNNTQSKNKQDKTAIFAEFDDIIKNADLNQIVPFLAAHKDGNVSELKKHLNKAHHYYLDWYEIKENGRVVGTETRGNSCHRRVISCFGFALLSANDFTGRWYACFYRTLNYIYDRTYDSADDTETNNERLVIDVIKHFEFKALFKVFLDEVVKQNRELNYWVLRDLEKANLIDYHAPAFSRGLVCVELPDIESWQNKIDLMTYRERFLECDIPSRDLMSLFEYEVNMVGDFIFGLKAPAKYRASGNNRLQYIAENGGYWLYLIPKYIEQGKLERDWVLQKCIEIQSNLWKQSSKKFFRDLFKTLNPTESEILSLQDNLLMLLHNELKTTVNFAVDVLKPFILHQAFNLEEFLTSVSPIMMNGEFKGTIKTLLTQFEKILKSDSKYITLIYPSLCNVLFVNDLALQEKAVKLLVKYVSQDALGDEWQQLLTQIETLFDGLSNDIKVLLTPIYQVQNELHDETKNENIVKNLLSDMNYHYDPVVRYDYFTDDKKIALYSEFNDILFNFGQLEYSNNPIDIEIFMASWLQLKANNQFPQDYLAQIKPVLEKHRHQYADNRIFSLFKANLLNHIFQNKDEVWEYKYEYRNFKIKYSYQAIIKKFLALKQHHCNLSLLSMPTHFPAFIEPKILAERLIAYQNADIDIDLTDYAIALARMPRVNIEPAIQLLSKIKNELIVESLKFALGLNKLGESIPPKHITERFNYEKDEHYQAWRGIFATIAKTHYPNIELDYSHEYKKVFDKVIDNHNLGLDYDFKAIREYDYESKKDIETGCYQIRFNINMYFNFSHSSDIYRRVCYYHTYSEYIDNSVISEFILPKVLMPLNQNDYDKYLSNYFFYDEYNINKHLLPIIEKLMSEDYPYNAYTQFILVACLFAKDKAVRLAGIDAIIYAISQFKLDIEMFARHSSEWIARFSAPFSRYTECMASLSQYNGIYQKVVLEIIESTLLKLAFKDKLPTNFKKYLENYYLLLSILNKKANKNVINKLQQWLEISNSIKTIVGKIGKL